MHPELQEAIDLHERIVAEAGNALVGYETEKALANIVLLSEIPTTYDKDQKRQVNAGNLLLKGVPGVGKTFFGVILAAISNAKFARLQGRADLQPTEIVGFQMINPATGELTTEFGPLASAVEGHPETCLLAEALLADVIGAPVCQACDPEIPRCRFEVVAGVMGDG